MDIFKDLFSKINEGEKITFEKIKDEPFAEISDVKILFTDVNGVVKEKTYGIELVSENTLIKGIDDLTKMK